MRKIILFGLLGLSIGAASAEGQNNYNAVGGYLELRDVGDGFRLGGSLLLTEQVYGFASYTLLSDNPVDTDILRVGGGLRLPIDVGVSGLEFLADLAYLRADFDTPGASGDASGLELRGGVHYVLPSKLILGGYIGVRTGDFDDTYIGGDLRYQFAPRWQVHGGIDLSDNDGLFVGLEYLY